MFTSDDRRRKILKIGFIYILITLFCVIFGAVYEKFSHGVYSYKMIYAFAAPLVLGAMSLVGLALRAAFLPGRPALTFWNCGIAALTAGLMFHGVLDIYGTTNQWVWVYYIAAGILLFLGLISYLYFDKKGPASAGRKADETADSGR